MQIPRGDIDSLGDGKIARLSLRNLPLVDTFQFAGPLAVAAAVDVDLRWRATGPFEQRGEGSTVDETSPGAFLGRFAPARCTGSVHGWETGFAFSTGQLMSDTFYAQLGREQNGVSLD